MPFQVKLADKQIYNSADYADARGFKSGGFTNPNPSVEGFARRAALLANDHESLVKRAGLPRPFTHIDNILQRII